MNNKRRCSGGMRHNQSPRLLRESLRTKNPPAPSPGRRMPATTVDEEVVSSTSWHRDEILLLMAKEAMWLAAATEAPNVAIVDLGDERLDLLPGSLFCFSAAGSIQLCCWLGTAVYFRLSGTRQQPVTRQQWRVLVASTFVFSFTLIVERSQYFLRAGDYERVVSSLGPVIVMAVGSLFFGKTWSTARKLAVAPIVASMALIFCHRMGLSVTGFVVSVLHAILTATLLVLNGELLAGEMEMSVVQLVSRTAPLALAQMMVLAFVYGEVAKLFSSKYCFHTILHAMAMTGPFSAPLSLLPLQANKVTSPLTISIASSVYRVLKAARSWVKFAHPVRDILLVVVVVATIRYTLLSFVERSRAFTQAPGSSSFPREQSSEQSQWSIEEGTAELVDAGVMLHPLLGAEAQSAARQQVHVV